MKQLNRLALTYLPLFGEKDFNVHCSYTDPTIPGSEVIESFLYSRNGRFHSLKLVFISEYFVKKKHVSRE